MKILKLTLALLALLVAVFLVSCNARVPTGDKPDDGMEEPDKGNDFNKTVIHDVTFFDKEVTYDGQEHSIFIEDELPYGVSVEYINNGQTNAGVYEITATLTSDDPEIIIEQSVHTATLTIKKKPIRDSIVFNDYTVEYNKYKNYVYAENLPNGVEVEYTNNGQTEVGVYTVEARFIDSTGNYDCDFVLTATLTVKKSSLLKTVTFYNEKGEFMSQVEVMKGSYVDGTLVPEFKREVGYTYSWDYDFHVPVGDIDLYIHLNKIPNEYTVYYHPNSVYTEKVEGEKVQYGQVLDVPTQEYDHFTYAYKYMAYRKINEFEYKPILDTNEEPIVIDGSLYCTYTFLEDVYMLALKDSRNIRFAYEIDSETNTATVTDFYAEEVTVPRAIYIDGREYIITSIKEGASEAHHFLTTLNFTPDSQLKEIGARAFKWSGLANITLPNTIEHIGEEAFASSAIRSITVLKNVNGAEITYGNYAFGGCAELTYLYIPYWKNNDISYLLDLHDYLKNITIHIGNLIMELESNKGFFGYDLNTVIIDSGYISGGFNSGGRIENLYLGKDVYFATEIPNVENVYVQKSVSDWVYQSYFTQENHSPAFYSNYFYLYENGEYVLFPSELTLTISPSRGALSGIKQLNKVTFDEGVTVINEYACAFIPNLKEVVIGSTVQQIKSYAFGESPLLETVQIRSNSQLKAIGGSAFYRTGLKSINLPHGLTVIYDLAFSETCLSEIFIPASVEKIGRYAFLNLTCHTVITFETGSLLKEIGAQAFFAMVDAIYFGFTVDEWQKVTIIDEWNDGIFLPFAETELYLLDGSGKYYLANTVINP